MDALIFDLDGTLWDSSEGVVEAWNHTLFSEGYGENWLTPTKLQGAMGKTISQIGAEFFPELSPVAQLGLVERCCLMEQQVLSTRGGRLYEELELVLSELSKLYELYIVSNCQEGYIETFLQHHRLGAYFKDFESHGRTKRHKGENIQLVIERSNIKRAIYIGDTQGDYEAARFAGIPFIHAAYGFGQISEAEKLPVINCPKELKEVAAVIFRSFNFLCKC